MISFYFVAYFMGQTLTFGGFGTMAACESAQYEVYGGGRSTIVLSCRYGVPPTMPGGK